MFSSTPIAGKCVQGVFGPDQAVQKGCVEPKRQQGPFNTAEASRGAKAGSAACHDKFPGKASTPASKAASTLAMADCTAALLPVPPPPLLMVRLPEEVLPLTSASPTETSAGAGVASTSLSPPPQPVSTLIESRQAKSDATCLKRLISMNKPIGRD